MKCHDFLQKHCLSCELLALDYAASIKLKEQKLASLFPDAISEIKPSIICQQTEETRNKAKLAVISTNGEIFFGFFDHESKFKKLENCPLQSSPINSILPTIKKLLIEYKIIPYDILSKKGELKYLLITYSKSSSELLIRFVLRSKESLDRLRKLTIELQSQDKKVKVVTANIQSVHQAILEGEEEIVLTNEDFITHRFGLVRLHQGPRSFFQTNDEMAQALYETFQLELEKLSINSLLDLYCGVGAFSFYANKFCKKVVGIEISKEAILYANNAKELNQSSDIVFQALDTELYLKQTNEAFDAIVVNPPRRGLNEAIIAQLLKLAPNYIFYSSCNADTLARDWHHLKDSYQLNSLRIFDMFPYTNHFETLTVLSRIKKD